MLRAAMYGGLLLALYISGDFAHDARQRGEFETAGPALGMFFLAGSGLAGLIRKDRLRDN